MSDKPTNFDFSKLKPLSPDFLDKQKEVYVFKSNMTVKGGTVVPKDSSMATMMVTLEIPKGTSVEGYTDDSNKFIFETEGGVTNSGKEYNGKVRYFFNLDEDVVENLPAPLDSVEGKKEAKKSKAKSNLLKVGIIATSVGVGYGISRIFKIKPIYPMIIAPVVVLGGLLVLDHMAWNKVVNSEEKK